MTFIRPSQSGGKVGMRAIGRLPIHYCPSTLTHFNIPEVYSDGLSSMGVEFNNFIWVGGTFGSTDPHNSTSINPDPFQEYQQSLVNLEFIANRRGADRNDHAWLESWYTSALVGYQPLTNAVAAFWSETSFTPPAVTFDDGIVNPGGQIYQLSAVYWKNNFNFVLIPSLVPWAIIGLLEDEYFEEPIGTFPNSTFCTKTALIGCPKPGFIHNSYPDQLYAPLGSQYQQ